MNKPLLYISQLYKQKNTRIALAFIFLASIFYIGYFVHQNEFHKLLLAALPAFVSYFVIISFVPQQNSQIRFWVYIAILSRIILIPSFPLLSDDIYRFIWDGHLIQAGIHPLKHLPQHYIENHIHIPGNNQTLLELLNSPNYFTIYPPFAQLQFYLATLNPHWDYHTSAIIMRSFVFPFEMANIVILKNLLTTFKLPKSNIFLYALNPLIIIELNANLHFEAVMIFFLLSSILLLLNKRNSLSSIALSFSISSKLLPLMYLPAILLQLSLNKAIKYVIILTLSLILIFITVFDVQFLQNAYSSLNLYFQRFEFNASIYYLLRHFGYKIYGNNTIQTLGPILYIVAASIILFISLNTSKNKISKTLFRTLLFITTTFLFYSLTIHPWYLSLPIVLCLFTPYRFPILWSPLIWLTYINYSYPTYYENITIVYIEYTIVFIILIWELIKHYNPSKVSR